MVYAHAGQKADTGRTRASQAAHLGGAIIQATTSNAKAVIDAAALMHAHRPRAAGGCWSAALCSSEVVAKSTWSSHRPAIDK